MSRREHLIETKAIILSLHEMGYLQYEIVKYIKVLLSYIFKIINNIFKNL